MLLDDEAEDEIISLAEEPAEESEEENEEGAKHSETEAEHSETKDEQSEQEEEMEHQEGSPLQDPVGEDELAEILANMGEYGQPSSPSDLHDKPQEENAPEKPHAKEVEEENLPVHDKETIGDTEQEQSIPNQKTPEEILEEAGAEKEVA